MQVRLTGDRGSAGWSPGLLRGLTIAVVTVATSLPALPQAATGTLNAVFCSVPATTPTGTTSTTGTTAIAVNCAALGATPAPQNIQFAAEGRVPTSFVLASQSPVLPTSLFNSIMAGTSELRQFVSLSGSILTFDLLAVQAGTPLPFSASLPTGTATLVEPTGTLINQIRIQVQNVTVTGGMHPTMLFSGVVTSPSTSGTTATTTIIGEAGTVIPVSTGSPLVPNLFGSVQGMAASVSLAFNSSFPFPGISITTTTTTGTTGTTTTATGSTSTGTSTGTTGVGVTGGTGTTGSSTGTGVTGGTTTTGSTSTTTGTTTTTVATASTGPFGTSGAVPITLLSVNVAGAFDLASPTGFATVNVVSGSTSTTTGTTGTTTSNSSIPVIQLAPFTLQTLSRTISLDASQSFSPSGTPITFNWTSAAAVSISGADTATPVITFPTTGTFPIQLTVTDGSGVQSSVVLPFVVLQ